MIRDKTIENPITSHIDTVSAFSFLTCFTGSNASIPMSAPERFFFLSLSPVPRLRLSAAAAAMAVLMSTINTPEG